MCPRVRVVLASCGIAACFALVQPALAQSKPSATPIENPSAYREPDVAGFARAYERDDRPTMLVLVGWANSQHQANDPASILFNNDPSGVTQQIKSAIEEVLNAPEADAELVNINALRASNERLRGVLETRGERDAVELIAQDLSAQLVLMVKLHGLASDGGIGKATVEAFRADRARTLFTIAFDWKGGTTAKELKINGRQIARAFIDDYARRLAGENRRLTLNILGVSDTADIRQAREIIEDVAGVDRVRRRSTSATRRDAVAQFEVTYLGTDPTTLADDAAAALEDLFGRLEIVKDEGGAITLRPTGERGRGVDFDDSRCIDDMRDDSAAGEAMRADLLSFARANGNPRVVVLINRDAPFADAPVPADANAGATASNMVVISLAERDAAAVGVGGSGGDRAAMESRRREAALQARMIEDALSDQLGAGFLGLRVVDADTVRTRLIAAVEARNTEGKNTDGRDGSARVSEAQLAAMLRSENLADIIITGVARVRPEGSQDPSATYTFRAVDARSAEVLGAAAIATPLALDADAPRVEAVATDAAAILGCKFLKAWVSAENAPRSAAPEMTPAPRPEAPSARPQEQAPSDSPAPAAEPSTDLIPVPPLKKP